MGKPVNELSAAEKKSFFPRFEHKVSDHMPLLDILARRVGAHGIEHSGRIAIPPRHMSDEELHERATHLANRVVNGSGNGTAINSTREERR